MAPGQTVTPLPKYAAQLSLRNCVPFPIAPSSPAYPHPRGSSFASLVPQGGSEGSLGIPGGGHLVMGQTVLPLVLTGPTTARHHDDTGGDGRCLAPKTPLCDFWLNRYIWGESGVFSAMGLSTSPVGSPGSGHWWVQKTGRKRRREGWEYRGRKDRQDG